MLILTENEARKHMKERETEVKNWLQTQFPNEKFELVFAAADADHRKYWRAIFDNPVNNDDKTVICMDAPPEKMSIEPFMNVQKIFLNAHLNVPKILGFNIERGLMILEDFGDALYLKTMLEHNSPDAHKALLLEAIDELIVLQKASQINILPEYDRDILVREMNLFPEFFLEKELKHQLNFKEKQTWQHMLDVIVPVIEAQPKVFVHRDFIVRNLMLTRGKVGILDFQDALYGAITYDLVSLLRDAFIEWDEEFVLDLVIRYWEKARAAGLPVPAEFDVFYKWFEFMGVQRHLKVAGIFARLWYRDGKDKYRPEIPRFLNYLRRTTRRYSELQPLYQLLLDWVGDEELQTGYTF